jgi:cytochrome oxidase assembly protein ShyY1
MSRYRFARRPLWIASHVLVGAIVILMIWAGFWQLRRFGDRRDLNRLYAERQAAPVTDIADVLDPASAFDDRSVDEAVFRRVTARGTYAVEDEVLVRNRTQGGRPGVWILTPLDLGDGTAVVVNRGFLPGSGTPDVPEEAAAPEGDVTVTGLVQATQERGRFGPTDPPDGELDTMSRVDLARLDDQSDVDLYPAWLILEEQAPAQPGEVPIPISPPEPFSETRHLSYAVQWFAFTLIALIGYPMILRRQARAEERRRRTDGPPVGRTPTEPTVSGSPVAGNGRRPPLDAPVGDRPSSPA